MKKQTLGTCLGVLVLGLAGGGCAATQVDTDYDRRANFAAYRTFDVRGGNVYWEGISDPGDTLVRDRMDAALTAELTEKGLRHDEARPDLIVRFAAATATRQEVQYDPVMWELGYWGAASWSPYWGSPTWGGTHLDWPYGGSPWVYEVEEGRMTIDVIDARTQRIVYHAETEAEDKKFRSPAYIKKAIDKALARYPRQG